MVKIISFLSLFLSLFIYSQTFEEYYEKAKQGYEESVYEGEVYDKAIELCPDISKYPELLAYKGVSLALRDESVLALKYINLALRNVKSDKDKMICYSTLSFIYYGMGKDSLEMESNKKALEYATAIQDTAQIRECEFNTLFSNLYNSEQKVKAKGAMVNFYQRYRNHLNLYDRFSYLVDVYTATHDEGLLKEYQNLRKSLVKELSSGKLSKDSKYEMYFGIADMDMNTGDYMSALKYCDSAVAIARQKGSQKGLIQHYILYKDIYHAKKDIEKEMQYTDSISIVEQSLRKGLLHNAVDLVKENQLYCDIQDKTECKISLLYVVLGALAVSILLLVLFLRFFDNRSKKITEKLEANKEQYNSLWADYQLSTKQLELTREELTKQLNVNENREMKGVLRDLSTHLNTNAENEHKHINMMKEGFIARLEEMAPYLNPQEKLVCFFISLKIPYKKIAELLNKTERSVSSYKYRINSKLKKNKGLSLEEFLQEMDSEDSKEFVFFE